MCGHLTECISPSWEGTRRPQTRALGHQVYFLQEVPSLWHPHPVDIGLHWECVPSWAAPPFYLSKKATLIRHVVSVKSKELHLRPWLCYRVTLAVKLTLWAAVFSLVNPTSGNIYSEDLVLCVLRVNLGPYVEVKGKQILAVREVLAKTQNLRRLVLFFACSE